MLYIVRCRLKESLLPKDMAEVNRLIDTKIISAATAVEGVRSRAGYQSFNGELVLMLDIADLATVDCILADKGCQAVFGEFYTHLRCSPAARFSSTGRRGRRCTASPERRSTDHGDNCLRVCSSRP